MSGDRLDLSRALATLADNELLRQPFVNAAYATGSLLAGLGTPTSDLDVVVLVESDADKGLAKQDKLRWQQSPIPADFEVYTVEDFAGFVGSCTDYRTAWRTGGIFHVDQALRVVSQFTAGARIFKASPEFTALSERIAACRQELVHMSVMHAVIAGNNTHEDLLGLMQDKDEVSVLRGSHEYLKFGLDAWCTAQGALYPDTKFKWLWRRLNRVFSDGPVLAALRALYAPETVTEPMVDVAARRVDVTQALLAQALLAAWAPHPAAFAVPVLPGWGASGTTMWRSPSWMPTRTPDVWGLGAAFKFYEMPLASAVAWAFAGGRTSSELEELVVDRCRTGFGCNVNLASARSAMECLLECGGLQNGQPSAVAARERKA